MAATVSPSDAPAGAQGADASGPGLRGSDLRLHVLRAGAVYDLGTRAVRRNAPTP